MAENEKILNTVIVLRHDTKEAWEADGTYVLRKGEIGIGYTSDNKVIVKAGLYDGKTESTKKTWKELPQIEGVFEDDLTLTYAFGKYAPDTTGSFTLNTAGKTMSEVMLDAFAQEVYTGLIKTYPSTTFTVAGQTTSKDYSAEVGSTYDAPAATLTLNNAGTYLYGAKNSKGESVASDVKFNSASLSYKAPGGSYTTVDTLENEANTATLTYDAGSTTDYTDSAVSYYFKASAGYKADNARPLTNLKNFAKYDSTTQTYSGTKDFSSATTNNIIPANSAVLNNKEIYARYTGWRNYWYGFINGFIVKDVTAGTPELVDNIQSRIVRTSGDSTEVKVTSTKKDGGSASNTLTAGGAAPSAKSLWTNKVAPTGACGIIVLVPTGTKTPAASLPDSLGAPAQFTKFAKAVTIPGKNGYTEKEYDLFIYFAPDGIAGVKFDLKLN